MDFRHSLYLVSSMKIMDIILCWDVFTLCQTSWHLGFLFRLLTAEVAWPVPAIIYVGIILSTLGAALQSLTGAPRLLAAIANDDILPVLKYFKVVDGGEPYLATLFTAFLCICCVIIGNLDLITPTITMFFLLCYAGVNLSCFLLDLLDAPSWRPRWRFHHWSLSLIGALMCIGRLLSPLFSYSLYTLNVAFIIWCFLLTKKPSCITEGALTTCASIIWADKNDVPQKLGFFFLHVKYAGTWGHLRTFLEHCSTPWHSMTATPWGHSWYILIKLWHLSF